MNPISHVELKANMPPDRVTELAPRSVRRLYGRWE